MKKNESINLLVLLKSLNIGGIEKSTIQLVKEISLLNVNVIIWTENGPLEKFIKLSAKFNIVYRKNNISHLRYSIPNILSLIQIIINNKIDIIHYHFRIFVPYIFVIKILFPKIKIIYTHHSFFNDILTKFIYADKYIAISNVTKSELLTYGKKNCIVIKHGIELLTTYKRKSNNKITNIGFVGRFHPSKGIFVLLEAFLQLLKNNKSIKLILKGEGELKGEILEFIRQNKLTESVSIKEPSLNHEEIYYDIDLLVVPSISLEGFGLVIIEAMSLEIPVIASDLPVFKELIINGNNGLLFENKNINDLINKIKILIENKNVRNLLSVNGYRFVRKKFNYNSNVNEYIKLISNL